MGTVKGLNKPFHCNGDSERCVLLFAANLVPAVCVVAMSFLDCTHVAAVMSLLVMSVGFTGFAFSSFLVNPYDIAPRYAISITSVTNTLACIPGILTTYVVAEVTTDVSVVDAVSVVGAVSVVAVSLVDEVSLCQSW